MPTLRSERVPIAKSQPRARIAPESTRGLRRHVPNRSHAAPKGNEREQVLVNLEPGTPEPRTRNLSTPNPEPRNPGTSEPTDNIPVSALHPRRQDLARPRGPCPAQRPDPAVHRPTFDPRGDESAGIRRTEIARAESRRTRADIRHTRSHRPHAQPGPAVWRFDGRDDDKCARAQLPRARHSAVRPGEWPSRHR